MKAYVMIRIRAGEVKEVVAHLRKITGVKEAHMTFGPYDAVAVVETEDVAKLGQITASEIQPIPGVEQTLTCLAVDVSARGLLRAKSKSALAKTWLGGG
ncbi:MAG: Lrp/AsnC ligand binding domain-containing protein [Anaerolineales bacterium]|nr:Lrp/AsnC ligand binding domain-containing protein [Anaerolineales bacterium]